MARRTTSIKDVAALAGVSLGTVSNVLNTPDLVAPATRERVESAISKLGWVRNESARQLRAGRSMSIGMIVMDLANPFFIDVVLGAEDRLHQLGYSVQLGNSAGDAEREATHLSVFEQQRVRGVLLAPIGPVAAQLAQLRQRGIPVVVVDRAGDDMDCCSATVDDVEGGRLAVRHLIDQGHKRIAVVGGRSELSQIRDRRLGAKIAAADAPEAIDVSIVPTSHLNTAGGVAAAAQIADRPTRQRPTAVFAANDLVALGLLQGFVTRGLRVPEEMAIIGYDDIEFAEAAAVPLSSIRQPRRELGWRATELMFEEISALEHDQPHEHRHVVFTPELVVRRSTSAGKTLNRHRSAKGGSTGNPTRAARSE
jgi:LacI family transcriptional regulator